MWRLEIRSPVTENSETWTLLSSVFMRLSVFAILTCQGKDNKEEDIKLEFKR